MARPGLPPIRARDAYGCNTGNVELAPGVTIDDNVLEMFCRTNGVRRLGLFGSALRGELRPDSDIDLLVEFEQGRVPGLLHLAALELELAELLGREVDLRTPGDLSRLLRDEISASSRVLYAAAWKISFGRSRRTCPRFSLPARPRASTLQ